MYGSISMTHNERHTHSQPMKCMSLFRCMPQCLVVCLLYQLFGASVMLGMKDAPDKTSSWFLSIIYVVAGDAALLL